MLDIPQWEKDFIDKRLEIVQNNPERLQPIETLNLQLNNLILT